MSQSSLSMSRRSFVRIAAVTCGGISFGIAGRAKKRSGKVISLFDGKTLRGWTQIENSAASLSASQISDPAAFIRELQNGTDDLSVFLRGQLDPVVTATINSPDAETNAKQVLSALIKNLNQIIAGPAIYTKSRFETGISLRPETLKLLHDEPRGYRLAQLNKLLIEDAYPAMITKAAFTGWIVKDDAMASTGAGRGVIFTDRDFDRFRLMFSIRHVSGNPDHQACVLIFCTRPQGDDEKPLDALGGIQLQVPNGGHWDYRQGMNNSGGPEFTAVTKTKFDPHDWSRVEIVADAAKGTARMAVAQPRESKAIEVLNFSDPAAGKVGPIAWQMHNAGLFDEYKDVTIELDPPDDELITVASTAKG